MTRSRLVGFLEYLLLFFVILEFNTPYMHFPFIKKGVYLMLLIIPFGLIMLKHKKIKVDIRILVVLVGALLPIFNVAHGHLGQYIRTYLIFFPMAVLYLSALFKEGRTSACSLLLKYSNIVIVLSVISLFFWIFGSMLEKISYTMLIPNSWGEEKLIPTYYGLYFETQEAMATASQMSESIRNSGIFNEAPMYNMILCVAIAIEAFIRPKLSKKRILILIITVFTTISTTGVIFLLLLFVGKLCLAANANQRVILLLGGPLISLFLYIGISTLLDNKKETGESSYDTRGTDIARCIEVGIENPFLGKKLFHKAAWTKYDFYGFSNSTFTVFAHGGFYFLSLYLLPLLVMPLLCYKRTKDIGMLGLMLSYFLLFTFTVSLYNHLTLLFMATSLSYWNVVFRMKNNVKTKFLTNLNYNQNGK